MVRSWRSCSKTNRSFSSITPLVFHGMRSFYTQSPKFVQCQGCSRSDLSRMCPVCTENEGHPTPRCFAKRVCKRLKINGAPAQKRGKRDKESASHWRGGSCEIGASGLAGAVAKGRE